MRLLLAVIGSLTAVPGLAASVPLSGDYGTAAGCSAEPPFTVDGGTQLLRVGPRAVNGLEWTCSYDQVTKTADIYSVAASCSSEGETSRATLTLAERLDGTLAYSDRNGTVTLHRCK
jgi:hypothetical protein